MDSLRGHLGLPMYDKVTDYLCVLRVVLITVSLRSHLHSNVCESGFSQEWIVRS